MRVTLSKLDSYSHLVVSFTVSQDQLDKQNMMDCVIWSFSGGILRM